MNRYRVWCGASIIILSSFWITTFAQAQNAIDSLGALDLRNISSDGMIGVGIDRDLNKYVYWSESLGTVAIPLVDADGLGSGIYFYRLRAGSFSATRKLIFIE